MATLRGLFVPTVGEMANIWGGFLNTLTVQQLENLSKRVVGIALTGNYTLTNTSETTEVDTKSGLLKFTDSSLSAQPTVTLPGSLENIWIVYNAGSTYAITFDAGATTVDVEAGDWGILYTDSSSNAYFLSTGTAATLQVGYAQEWAKAAEDTPVSVAAGGDASTTFSALHHAAKAENSATAAAASAATIDVTNIDNNAFWLASTM